MSRATKASTAWSSCSTLRRRGISDAAVLRAMDEVPREHFVRAGIRRRGLCGSGAADRLRPDHQPALCGRLYDRAARACSRDHRVLEVGTGSGYQAAVLSRLAREVVSIERYRTLADTRARRRLDDARLSQCRGDGRRRARRRCRRTRRTTASSSRRRPKPCPRRWSSSSPTAASWCCRSGRMTARSTS